MGPTTFTSVVLVGLALVLLTMVSYAWLGDWEPQPRRTPEDRTSREVEALRRAIETYEREQRDG